MSNSPLAQFNGVLIDGLQFCAMTYSLFEQMRSIENGPSQLRMRATDVEKKLIEELLPIAKYVQEKYRAGRYISIRWVKRCAYPPYGIFGGGEWSFCRVDKRSASTNLLMKKDAE